MAHHALNETIQYTKDRKAFGREIHQFQHNSFKLAELATKVQMGQVFLDRCLELHIQGKLDISTAAMSKYALSDMACEVIDECVQLHGGYGYMWEYDVAKLYVDARVQKIYGGSNEIMKDLIYRGLMK